MANFLNALQGVSNKMNDKRAAVKASPVTAGQAWAKTAAVMGLPLPADGSGDFKEGIEPSIEDNTCRVNLVLNRRRIDVLFPAKPSEFILQSLRDAGFRFRPSDKAWFHQDSPVNRSLLNRICNAGIEDAAEDNTDPAVVDAPVVAAVAPVVIHEAPVERHAWRAGELICLPDWETYKSQCGELAEHFGLELADLGLLAIDRLHKAVFAVN